MNQTLPFWFDFNEGVHLQLSSFEPQFYFINIKEFPSDLCNEIQNMIEHDLDYESMLIQFYKGLI